MESSYSNLTQKSFCQFCEEVVSCQVLQEFSDRLHDFVSLKGLTLELKCEIEELMERNKVIAVAQIEERTQVETLQSDHADRIIEENTSRRIDSYCLQLAEDSVELQKENEILISLQKKRQQIEIKRDLNKQIKSSLIQNMTGMAEAARTSRWREVISVFRMIPITVEIPTRTKVFEPLFLRGTSTVMGLPLLNSGNYDGIPAEIVSSALSFAAHLIDTIASILNIHLDHPLRPFETFECVISPSSNLCLFLPLTPAINQNPSNMQHLWAPFAANWRYKVPEVKGKRKLKMEEKHDSRNAIRTPPPQTASNNEIGDAAIGNKSDWVTNATFPLALSIFRANVIALCVRSGIDPSALWPSEAILLNLNTLYLHCLQQIEKCSTDFHSLNKAFPTVYSSTEENGNIRESGLMRRYRSQRIVNMGENDVDLVCLNELNDGVS